MSQVSGMQTIKGLLWRYRKLSLSVLHQTRGAFVLGGVCPGGTCPVEGCLAEGRLSYLCWVLCWTWNHGSDILPLP